MSADHLLAVALSRPIADPGPSSPRCGAVTEPLSLWGLPSAIVMHQSGPERADLRTSSLRQLAVFRYIFGWLRSPPSSRARIQLVDITRSTRMSDSLPSVHFRKRLIGQPKRGAMTGRTSSERRISGQSSERKKTPSACSTRPLRTSVKPGTKPTRTNPQESTRSRAS
jgi:hypothetical protein